MDYLVEYLNLLAEMKRVVAERDSALKRVEELEEFKLSYSTGQRIQLCNKIALLESEKSELKKEVEELESRKAVDLNV